MSAQTVKKPGNKKEHSINMKGLKLILQKNESTLPSFHLFHSAIFHSKLSVNLLEGSGIHLFSVSDIDPLPSFSIGARFNAGLIITI